MNLSEILQHKSDLEDEQRGLERIKAERAAVAAEQAEKNAQAAEALARELSSTEPCPRPEGFLNLPYSNEALSSGFRQVDRAEADLSNFQRQRPPRAEKLDACIQRFEITGIGSDTVERAREDLASIDQQIASAQRRLDSVSERLEQVAINQTDKWIAHIKKTPLSAMLNLENRPLSIDRDGNCTTRSHGFRLWPAAAGRSE